MTQEELVDDVLDPEHDEASASGAIPAEEPEIGEPEVEGAGAVLIDGPVEADEAVSEDEDLGEDDPEPDEEGT